MRRATVEDIPHLCGMFRRFHEKFKDCPFVQEDAERFFAGVIKNGAVFVTNRGFIAGMTVGLPSNQSELTAHELFWWSEGNDGAGLRRAFEDWATKMGCKDMQISHPYSQKTVGRMLERAGYTRETLAWSKPCA